MKYNLIFSFLFIAILAGCYTVYQHPNVVHKDDNGRVELIEVSYKNNCASCHSEQELEKYNYYVKKDIYIKDEKENEEIVSYNSVAYYYNMPWWFEISFTDVYTPVRYDTGINGEVFDNSGRSGSYLPPTIFIPSPTVSEGSGNTSNNSGSQTRTRNNTNSNEKQEKKNDSQKSDNTRNNDGNRNNGTGRR
ncbi:MAG TPA: hypothetical protein PL041_12395 [Melioribacteraceae bacterium]|nr:hypothetical protein [Melioribacteraceae bacterium]